MTEICHFCATDLWEIQIPTQKMATRRKNRRSEEKTEALKRKTENRRQDKYLQRRFYQLRAIVSVVNIQSIQSVCKCYVFSRTQIAHCCFSMKTIHCHSSMDWKAQKWVLHSRPFVWIETSWETQKWGNPKQRPVSKLPPSWILVVTIWLYENQSVRPAPGEFIQIHA